MSKENKKPSNLVKSVNRSIDIISLLSSSEKSLGVTEISERLNLPKSTVSRLLSTLYYREFVQKDKQTKRYSLGLKLFELGSQIFNELDLRKIVKPFLEDLANEINETVHFVIEDNGEVLYIEKIESSHGLRQYSQIGKRGPLYCTGVGKAFLSTKNMNEIDNLLKNKELISYTKNTITNVSELKKELKVIKQKGYAIDNEEINEGVKCIAVPIFDYTGSSIGAISISGPTFRMKNTEEKADKLMDTAKKISRQLGHQY
jgi:DNA-binding IclR family transcriptional regulator